MRPHKLLTNILLLFTVAFSTCQPSLGQTPGRVWFAGPPPATKPTNYQTGDVWRDTVAKVTYGYKSGWYIRTDQFAGPAGSTGPQGPTGAPGTCPPCPSSTLPDFGTLKFVRTETEMRAALAGFGDGTTTAIFVCKDIGATTAPFTIPPIINSRAKKPCIYLNGNALYDNSPNGLPVLITRSTTTQDSALNKMQDVAIIIRDGELIGKGTGTALDLAATYGTVIEAVDVTNFYDGDHLRFCLMAAVRNCIATNIRNQAFIADTGNWVGASGSNSQSNSSRFEQCRVFHYDGADAAFVANAASGMIWEQDISEGGTSNYGWKIRGAGSTVVKDGLLHMGHSENTPKIAHVSADMPEGVFQLDGLFHQYPGVVLDATSSGGYPHFYVRNIPYMVPASQFKIGSNNCIMTFEEMPSTWDASQTTNWVGGITPYYWQQKGMKQAPFWNFSTATIGGGLLNLGKFTATESTITGPLTVTGTTKITGTTTINGKTY